MEIKYKNDKGLTDNIFRNAEYIRAGINAKINKETEKTKTRIKRGSRDAEEKRNEEKILRYTKDDSGGGREKAGAENSKGKVARSRKRRAEGRAEGAAKRTPSDDDTNGGSYDDARGISKKNS